MLTLDTHLTGVTADRPHPDGYRPDFPLRSDLFAVNEEVEEAREEGRESGYSDGRFDGKEEARAEASATERALTHDLTTVRDENTALRKQLEAKRA